MSKSYPMKELFKKLIPHLLIGASLLTSWVSVASFGKDNVVELIAKVVIETILEEQCTVKGGEVERDLTVLMY